ncbi:MAG: hypothetical protein ACR2H3_02275 [Acidimicrobiales bacterium]
MVQSTHDDVTHRASPAIRAAAVMYLALGLGFGAGTVITLAYLARDGELPMTPWGFRSLSGPFEKLGPSPFTALGLALIGVCVMDVVAGIWLWQGRRRGGLLGLATTPLAFVLGVGFALPFLLVGVPIRVALVLAGRRSLR